jgi:hypothetical protein
LPEKIIEIRYVSKVNKEMGDGAERIRNSDEREYKCQGISKRARIGSEGDSEQ